MDESLTPKTRILSYLYSPEWVIFLVNQGFEVDLLETFHRDVWPHTTHELPEGVGFVQDVIFHKYRCSVVPVPPEIKDSVAMEALEKFITMQKVVGLACIVICPDSLRKVAAEIGDKVGTSPKVGPENAAQGLVGASTPPPVATIRLKRRWPMATTPPWMRICHMIVTLIVGDNQEEPEGKMIELDCGDGALLQFLQSRFGKCDLIGHCFHEEEKELARRVNDKAPVAIIDKWLDGEMADYIICNDADLKDIVRWRNLMEHGTRKKAVLTILKKQESMPDPNWLRDQFKDWKMYEIPGHYAFYWEVKHEA